MHETTRWTAIALVGGWLAAPVLAQDLYIYPEKGCRASNSSKRTSRSARPGRRTNRVPPMWAPTATSAPPQQSGPGVAGRGGARSGGRSRRPGRSRAPGTGQGGRRRRGRRRHDRQACRGWTSRAPRRGGPATSSSTIRDVAANPTERMARASRDAATRRAEPGEGENMTLRKIACLGLGSIARPAGAPCRGGGPLRRLEGAAVLGGRHRRVRRRRRLPGRRCGRPLGPVLRADRCRRQADPRSSTTTARARRRPSRA